MIFHQNFCTRHMDICATPEWFTLRSNLYKEISEWKDRPFDQVYFDFTEPADGWIDVSVFVNGAETHTFPLSAACDPFGNLKIWMEDIVNDYKISSEMYIEAEGRTIILHYEHIKLAQVCFINEEPGKDEWESYDANNSGSDTGLFYIYDSAARTLPVVCYCRTKDILLYLYNGLMYYASRTKSAILIGKEWYYAAHDDDGNPIYDNWDFYNTLKSPLLEWNLDSELAYRHEIPTFYEAPKILETVHMWAEWADALFWHQRGGCCGNAERFFVDTENTEIDLTDMPELRIWYDEFNNSDIFAAMPEEWYKRGWEIAKKVRMRLPQSVDLFYEWKPFPGNSKGIKGSEIPILVPDDRLRIKKN